MNPAVSRKGGERTGEMVSVLVPAYNAEPFLERAVLSALGQTHADLEVLVIDDGSTDGTRGVAEDLAARDARVRVLHLPVNSGPSAARNAGLDAARGDWIAILDADDAFSPERLSFLLAVAAERKADVVADNVLLYDARARKVERALIDPAQLQPLEVIGIHRFVENCLHKRTRSLYTTLKPIIRRELIERMRLRYPVEIRHGEDFVFYIRLLLADTPFILTRQALYLYTQPMGGLSGQASGMSRTRRGYDRLYQYTKELMAEKNVRTDAQLMALLREWNRGLIYRHTQQEFSQLRRAGAYREILRRCLRDPRLAHFLAAKVVQRARLLAWPKLDNWPHSPTKHP